MSARNRILVVEDDASILDLICMNLEAAGYETIVVGDGLEAERLLRENGPDTADGALVDIMLPGKDGFELMDYLQEYQIPVIFITARAAVADPPVMILDEATSSIDTRTEALVQSGMDKLMEGRTVFVIAHRLSTVKNADVIMVLDHGRIIERGNHAKLIAEKGVYYQLYTGAFELE